MHMYEQLAEYVLSFHRINENSSAAHISGHWYVMLLTNRFIRVRFSLGRTVESTDILH